MFMNPTLYFDDLKVGETFTTGSKTISLEEIIAFAKEYDPQPMHTDVEAAKHSFFGTLVGSGLHTLTTTMRLVVDAKPFGETPLVGMQVDEVRLLSPLYPNSTLSASLEILELTPSSKGGRGYVRAKITTRSGDKELATQKWLMLMPNRPTK